MIYTIDGKRFEVGEVLPDKPVWLALLNGEDITDQVRSLAIINREMGIGFLYGASLTDGPYNQGHLYNRGGAVIILKVKKNGENFIAVLEQMRPLQKPVPIFEFPRGQSNPGESGVETALRELLEETGIRRDSVYDVEHLGSGNPDNALTLGENIHFVTMSLLETDVDWDNMQIRPDTFRPDAHSRLSEQIHGSKVVPLKGFTSPSMMTMSAIGHLRAYLDSK